MYLIGSAALYHTGDAIKFQDYDLVLENELIEPQKGIDIGPNDIRSLDVCRKYDSGIVVDTPVGQAKVVAPIGIMLMKRSHLHRPIKFAKHIQDYHRLKAKYFSQVDPEYFTLLAERTKLTKEKYGDKTPKLNKSKDEFFDDYVKKIYEHDHIHYATCHYDEPIYELLKSDSDSVWCSKKLWDQLLFENKIKCVREEAYVIAIERYLMWKRNYPPKFAFDSALERICTTLTGGWFRDFAIENWPEIRNHNYPFLQKFKDAGFVLECEREYELV